MAVPLDLPLLHRPARNGYQYLQSSPRATDEHPLADTPRVPSDPTFAPEDYTALLYNLSSWSYRVSRQEYSFYQQRRLQQLRKSLGTDSIVPTDITQQLGSPKCRPFNDGTSAHSSSHGRIGSSSGSGVFNPRDSQISHSIRHQELSFQKRLHLTTSTPETSPSPFTSSSSSSQRMQQYRGRSFLGLPMLPATHRFMLGWAVFMLIVDLTYTAVLLPLLEAFESNRPGKPLFWFSITMGSLFVMDMLVVLHRAVVVKYLDKYMYVDCARDCARLYIWHGQFWTDLVVCMSAPCQIIGLLVPWIHYTAHGSSRALSVLMNCLILLRGLRLIKLLLLQRELFLGKFGMSHLSRRRTWYIMSLIYILGVMFNWLACIMIFISRHQDQHLCWLASVKGHNLTKAPAYKQYIASLYWVVVTTATVGYGDVSAGTPVEQVAIVGAVLVGLSFVAYCVKTLMDVMVEAALQDENAQRVAVLRDRAQVLKLWGTWQDLPAALMERINSYNAGPWLTHTVLKRSWEGVLQDLPPDLKGEMLRIMLVERHRELSPLTNRLLQGVPRSSAHALLALLEPRPLAPGQMLCWCWEPATEVWVLQEGELVTLQGILPTGQLIDTPGVVEGHDLAAWVQQQLLVIGRQQQQQQQQGQEQGQQGMPQQVEQQGQQGRGQQQQQQGQQAQVQQQQQQQQGQQAQAQQQQQGQQRRGQQQQQQQQQGDVQQQQQVQGQQQEQHHLQDQEEGQQQQQGLLEPANSLSHWHEQPQLGEQWQEQQVLGQQQWAPPPGTHHQQQSWLQWQQQQQQQPPAGQGATVIPPAAAAAGSQPASSSTKRGTPFSPCSPAAAAADGIDSTFASSTSGGPSPGFLAPPPGGWLNCRSLQSTTTSFLWAIPLNRLALALTSMPQIGVNLLKEKKRQQQQQAPRRSQEGRRTSQDILRQRQQQLGGDII